MSYPFFQPLSRPVARMELAESGESPRVPVKPRIPLRCIRATNGEPLSTVGCIPCTSTLEDWHLPSILLSRAGGVVTLVYGMHPTGFDRKATR